MSIWGPWEIETLLGSTRSYVLTLWFCELLLDLKILRMLWIHPCGKIIKSRNFRHFSWDKSLFRQLLCEIIWHLVILTLPGVWLFLIIEDLFKKNCVPVRGFYFPLACFDFIELCELATQYANIRWWQCYLGFCLAGNITNHPHLARATSSVLRDPRHDQQPQFLQQKNWTFCVVLPSAWIQVPEWVTTKEWPDIVFLFSPLHQETTFACGLLIIGY